MRTSRQILSYSGTWEFCRTWQRTICMVIILAGIQYQAQAQRKTGRTIVYGGDKFYPPYEFINAKGQPDGFHIDLMTAIGEVMGFKATFRLDNWTSIRKLLEEEKSVDVTDMFFSSERAEIVEFANPHAVISHELISRGDEKKFQEIDDIVGASIIVEKGTVLEDLLKKSELGLEVIAADSEQDALTLLTENNYDFALVSGYQAHLFIAENKKFKISPVGPIVFPLELSFVTAKGRLDLIQDINTGLEILKKTGKYSKLYIKWFGEKETSLLTKIFKWAGKSLLILLVLSIFWIQTLRRMVKVKTFALKNELDEKIAAEEKLKTRERELQEAQKMANLGNWKYDFKSKTTVWSDEQKRIFGLDKDEKVPEYEDFLKFIHPQDRKLVTDTFSQAVDKPIIYTFEVRAVNKKKEYKNLLVKIKPTYNGINDKIIGLNGTVMDITTLKDVQKKLETKNEELQKKNFELDKFAYSISHDIQAPIASISGLVNLMKLDLRDEKAQSYTEKIELCVKKLTNYIRDVLSFSINENKKVDSDVIDFEDIIKESFALRQYMNGAKDVELVLDIDVKGDFISNKSRLMLIFGNIISNAIKYQKRDISGSYLKITIIGDSKEVNIVVEDNGEGIVEEHIDNIFNMFYRGSINSDGSGLGLYIVREVVHTLGGTIHVQSSADHGTNFMIGLPAVVSETN